MMNEPTNPAKWAMRRYLMEFGLSMAAYVGVMLVSRMLLEGPMHHAANGWQLLVALSPLVTVIFVFIAIVRWVMGTDEMMRRICVNSLAIAGGATALLAVTYGLIEGDSLPRLSAWWTYGTFMMAWLIATFFVRRHYR
jgi:hypothetical protein